MRDWARRLASDGFIVGVDLSGNTDAPPCHPAAELQQVPQGELRLEQLGEASETAQLSPEQHCIDVLNTSASILQQFAEVSTRVYAQIWQ